MMPLRFALLAVRLAMARAWASGSPSSLTAVSGLRYVDGGKGNDTIIGGGGHDKVVFDVTYADATISTHHGTTTVAFGDGQTMTISGVEQLVFTDQTVKPH